MPEVYSPQTLSRIPRDRDLYGVIGWPVAHSLSPVMQQAAFDACDLKAQYVRIAIAPEALAESVTAMRALPLAGWNGTIPHKNALFPLMDVLDPSAREIGGVNTVVNCGGTLTGHSTDGRGWARAVREEFDGDIKGLRILLLGTGGAGQAIAHQAVAEGCGKLVLVNRTLENARQLAGQLAASEHITALPWDPAVLSEVLPQIDLIVNASSVGLKAEDPPALPASLLQKHHWVYDTIYHPSPTGLLQSAAAAGARTANGLSMLLHQGALSFEIWTGRAAPLEAMRKALYQAAGQRA